MAFCTFSPQAIHLKRCSYEEVEQAGDRGDLRRLRNQFVLFRRFLMSLVASVLPSPVRMPADIMSDRP
jgi:hypothetical protein